MRYDICTIGDGTIDTFLAIHQAQELCNINQKERMLGLDFGAKIPVDEIYQSVGGNAFNVAHALAKLELKVALAGFVGSDEPGNKALYQMQKAGINTSYTCREGKTNQSVVISFSGERTILSYKEKRNYPFKNLPKCEWYFLTSTGPGSENFLHQFVKKCSQKIIFNPGTYQLRMDKKFLKEIIKKSYALFVNLEEAYEISGLDRQSELKTLLASINELGPEIVIITNGKEGAYAYDSQNFWTIPSLSIKVVDPTGAGDSFSAAAMAALIYKKGINTALLWGILNSTSLIQKLGTEEGLLSKDEILKLEKKTKLAPHIF